MVRSTENLNMQVEQQLLDWEWVIFVPQFFCDNAVLANKDYSVWCR